MQSHIHLSPEETSLILSLIVCTCPPLSPAGTNFIEITLAMLLACPFLIRYVTGYNCLLRLLYTVEPPNSGHVGTRLFREVVLSSELKMY